MVVVAFVVGLTFRIGDLTFLIGGRMYLELVVVQALVAELVVVLAFLVVDLAFQAFVVVLVADLAFQA